jgi:hypothetical protein
MQNEDQQEQCQFGHFYTVRKGYSTACPICAESEDSLNKTRIFDNKTRIIPETTPFHTNAGKTIGAYANLATATEPVVGWVACTKGPHAGQDWRLIAGRNSVGRSTDHAVALVQDSSVSRERHAFITFDPKHKRFRVQPGDSSGLVYLNGEEVAVPTEIKPYDLIEVGKTGLVFVALVSESFSWATE